MICLREIPLRNALPGAFFLMPLFYMRVAICQEKSPLSDIIPYIFAVVPLSLVFLTAAEQRGQSGVVIGALGAYVMMSPPVPYSVIDHLGWFQEPFAYVWNLHDVPTFGALLLLGLTTYQWLACSPYSSRESLLKA